MKQHAAVKTVCYKASDIKVPLKEVGRYLGLGRSQPDAGTVGLLEKALADFQKAVVYRACYLEVPVRTTENETDFGIFTAEGKNLAKHLAGCSRAILFAATTGMEAERQRKRAAVVSAPLAVALDAVGTAAVEEFCDLLCRDWAEEYPGAVFRSRFSPGYGDLPLTVQTPLLNALQANQNAGILLTEALLMIPQKSVSAIIGIGQAGCAQKKPGCAVCNQQDCTFRL